MLFAPLIGLELDDLPDPLIDAGFPLSWLWPGQLGGLEDPDIRRDWISQNTTNDRPLACLALTAPGDFDHALDPLRRRADTAVIALRLAGIAGVHDPDLLGVYARDGGGLRYRRAAVYRQTVIRQRAQLGWPLDEEEVADIAALWPLLLEYEAGRRAPEIDHALSLFRRAHIWLGLSVATRLELLFASLEAALGRGAAESLARLAERAHDATPRRSSGTRATGWRSAMPSPTANGRRTTIRAAAGALRHLLALLGEVLPALLMAWRARRKARPAKTLVAALRDPRAELDWRVAVPAERASCRRRASCATAGSTRRSWSSAGGSSPARATSTPRRSGSRARAPAATSAATSVSGSSRATPVTSTPRAPT